MKNSTTKEKRKLDNKHKGKISDWSPYYITMVLATLNSIAGGPPIIYILLLFLPSLIYKLKK